MTSSRPYLIRAVHSWIIDNDRTPYILVDATVAGVIVPQQHVDNNKIILNLSPRAVSHLEINNTLISFDARFGGVAMIVQIPPSAVLAIYARENGQGMIFDKDDGDEPAPTPPPTGKARPKLRVVK